MKHLLRQAGISGLVILFTFSPLMPVLAQTASSTTQEVQEIAPVPTTTDSLPYLETPSSTVSSSTPTKEEIPSLIETKPERKIFHYTTLMRKAKSAKEKGSQDDKKFVASDVESFVAQEKENLDTLGVNAEKQKKYFKRLHTQVVSLDSSKTTLLEKIKDFFGDILPSPEIPAAEKQEETKTPVSPAQFNFSDDAIPVTPLQNSILYPSLGQKIQTELKNFITVPPAQAIDDQFLPTLQDVQASDDAPINDTLKELATALHNNPVEIMNYVKNAIVFEPYAGLKKGALGCLQQKVCNDIDSAALTISLFRSAGIPAHYKKSLAIFKVEDVKNLFGVEDTKAVYAAFALNKVPVFTVTVPIPAGATLDQVDLSNETALALQWVVPEVFYEYNEEGGNVDNELSFATATTTESVRTALNRFPKKQWIPLDVIMKPYTHQKRDVLSDRVGINISNFWNNYLTYQGSLSPLEKFRADVQALAGGSATSSLSTQTPQERKFTVLPLTLPFIFASGNNITEENWSTLPATLRPQLKISLVTENNQVVLEKNFFSTEIDNKELSIAYDGVTDADKRVIEQYGGMHQTPAELVDIVPYFQNANGRMYNNNPVPVNIGDTLVLRFEMTFNNQTIQRDEKFSLAGNSEGIYVVFSQVEEKPEFNTNQKILAGGNAALAWKYLSHLEQERKFLNEFYDFSSNLHFARAVVTENRVLSRVNNTPTTFDFKGLTIDAGAYLASDVSRRLGYTLHRSDVRLLFGLDASFYEGRVFEEVAGLEGISTVKGLQYAAAHPQNYTVLRIATNNEAVINTLPFSNTTKQNMHTAVQAGNTVITPDQVVQVGNWQGILYINISPAGTGQYAIGEQTVQNGGWTVSTMLSNLYQVSVQDTREGFLYNFGDSHFYYEDGKNYDTVLCRITDAEFRLVTSRPDWRAEYGYPCLLENKQFGATTHSYILSSNGAYFFSPNLYDYWVSRDNVKGTLLTDKNGEPQERLLNVRLDGEFKFNPIAGTYSWFGHYDGPAEDWNLFADCRNCLTAYYQPMQNRVGHGRLVYGSILRKLAEPHYNSTVNLCAPQDPYCAKRNWILNSFGFPLSNRAPAAKSIAETEGDYQVFVGGHIYRKDYFGSSKIFYVPNIILQKFNADEFLLNGNRGTGGKFGFPLSDPFYSSNTSELLQKFEWKLIQLVDGHINIIRYTDNERRLNSKEYGLKLFTKVVNGELTDIEALVSVGDYLAYITDNAKSFLTDLLIFYTGSDKVKNYGDIPGKFEFYLPTFLWSDTGFKFKYNDSHYCMENTRNEGSRTENYICISDQPLHAIAAMAAGYDYGDFARIGGKIHEKGVNPLGHLGSSKEDVNLTSIMIGLGADLKLSRFSKEQFGAWILNNLGEPGQSAYRISRKEIERIAGFRKFFRVFEYEQNGNINSRWAYSKDVERINCLNGVDTYYQDYDYFILEGRNIGKARAILDKINGKVILLSGEILSQYENSNLICRDFFLLSNNSSYNLHMRFNPDASGKDYLIDELNLEKYERPYFNS